MFWVRQVNFAEFSAGQNEFADRFNVLAQFEQEYGADLFGFTVTRIRGRVKALYDTTTVVERREFSFGIKVASQSDVAVDSTHLPSIAPHEDWMFTLTDAGQLTNMTEWKEYEYVLDIKGQRRIDELGDSLFMYIGLSALTNPPLTGGVTQFVTELNVLCKRP